jgi:hypothetical protein
LRCVQIRGPWGRSRAFRRLARADHRRFRASQGPELRDQAAAGRAFAQARAGAPARRQRIARASSAATCVAHYEMAHFRAQQKSQQNGPRRSGTAGRVIASRRIHSPGVGESQWQDSSHTFKGFNDANILRNLPESSNDQITFARRPGTRALLTPPPCISTIVGTVSRIPIRRRQDFTTS